MDISIVIPAFNEEESVVVLCKRCSSVLRKMRMRYEIIVVDDGSSDNTFKALADLKENEPNLVIIKLRKNYGQTAALDAGFKNAKGENIVSLDGDLQNDPSDIPRLVSKLNEGYDVVCGWRRKRKDSIIKNITSISAYYLRKIIIRDNVHDSGCTLRAYKRKCLDHIQLYGEMHRFIPALLLWEGFKVAEIEVTHHPRAYGRSKYNMGRIIKGGLDMLIVKFWMKYSLRPIHLFGGLGVLMGIIGFSLGGYLSILKLFYHESIGSRPLLLLSVFLMVIGLQFIIFGVLADIMVKIYYGEKRRSYFIERVY